MGLEIQPYEFLTSTLDGFQCQIHASATLSPPPFPFKENLAGPRAGLDAVRGAKSLLTPRFEPRPIGRPSKRSIYCSDSDISDFLIVWLHFKSYLGPTLLVVEMVSLVTRVFSLFTLSLSKSSSRTVGRTLD